MSAQLKYDIKIFIIGMMGAGKSSAGLALSQLIDIPFIDTDELIGIDSYFDNHTMDEFRLEEENQINKIVKQSGSYVVSVGGGAVLSEKNREILAQHSCIFLRTQINTLISRVRAQNVNRPLIKFINDSIIDKDSFRQLYHDRESYYLELATFIIDTDKLDILNVAKNINQIMLDHEIIN